MEAFTPGDLKTILHSKRANLYYLEHCRVLVKGGRVEYVTEDGDRSLYWNIPIANTTTVLLGTGTSITQAAVRELAKAGVMMGFCGGGGTPLFAGSDGGLDIGWLSPQSEYRPTEYLQQWVAFWFDDRWRLEAAKAFQRVRLSRILRCWEQDRVLREQGFAPDTAGLEHLLHTAQAGMGQAADTVHLLTEEARMTHQLYRLARQPLCHASGPAVAHAGRPSLFESAGAVPPAAQGRRRLPCPCEHRCAGTAQSAPRRAPAGRGP